jgi:hypothetical protein
MSIWATFLLSPAGSLVIDAAKQNRTSSKNQITKIRENLKAYAKKLKIQEDAKNCWWKSWRKVVLISTGEG